ncbi:hypothetical protein NG794_12125 [Laspinema sp. D6]|nr:hypothetical protein [Laspinema sp. D3a]
MVTFDAVVPIFSSSGNWRSRFNSIWRQFGEKVGESLQRDRPKSTPNPRVLDGESLGYVFKNC